MLESIFGLVSKKRLAIASDEIKFLKSSLESAEQSYSYVRGQMNKLLQVNSALAKENTEIAIQANNHCAKIAELENDQDEIRAAKEHAESLFSDNKKLKDDLRKQTARACDLQASLTRDGNHYRDSMLAMDQENEALRKKVVELSDGLHAEKQGKDVAEAEMTVQQFIDSNKLKISPMNLAQRAISLGGSRDSTAKARDKKGRLRTVKTFPVSILSKAVQIHNTPA